MNFAAASTRSAAGAAVAEIFAGLVGALQSCFVAAGSPLRSAAPTPR